MILHGIASPRAAPFQAWAALRLLSSVGRLPRRRAHRTQSLRLARPPSRFGPRFAPFLHVLERAWPPSFFHFVHETAPNDTAFAFQTIETRLRMTLKLFLFSISLLRQSGQAVRSRMTTSGCIATFGLTIHSARQLCIFIASRKICFYQGTLLFPSLHLPSPPPPVPSLWPLVLHVPLCSDLDHDNQLNMLIIMYVVIALIVAHETTPTVSAST